MGRRGRAVAYDGAVEARRSVESLRSEVRLQLLLAVVFVFLAVVLATVSWFVFPQVAYPDRPGPLTTWVNTSRTINTIELEARGSSDGTMVTVRVYAGGKQGDGGETAPTVSIKTPGEPIEVTSGVAPSDCYQRNTFVAWLDAVNQFSGVNVASPEWESLDAGGLVATMTVRMDGPSIGLYCNEWACRGSVPMLLVDPGVALADSAYGRAFLAFPNMHSYRWQAQGSQTTGSSELVQTTTPLGLTTSAEATMWKPLDGDSSSAAQSATQRSFIAGALIGVAGGAAIAAVQCFITWVARTRELRRTAG